MKNKSKEPKYVKGRLPADRHEALRHLGLELGLSLDDLLNESVLLLLRFHGRQGLPEPLPPERGRPPVNTVAVNAPTGSWFVVIHVAQTPTETWVVVRDPCARPLVTVWLQVTGHPTLGQTVFLADATLAQGIPYDPDATPLPLGTSAVLPWPTVTTEPVDVETNGTLAPVYQAAPLAPPPANDQAQALASAADAEVEAELQSIRTCIQEGHDRNLCRQIGWLGIKEGEVFALQTLGQTRKEPTFLALARSADEAARLSAPDGLTAPNRWGKNEHIVYQGVYLVGNRLIGRMDEVVKPGGWAPMGEGVITDARIRSRRFFYLDLDTQRTDVDGTAVNLPISATRAELHATIARSVWVRADIIGALGAIGVDHPVDAIATMMSGNGVQLWLALDELVETPELHDLVKELLALWSVFYDHPSSHVDTSVCDPKRIAPLAGTPKRKGVRAELHRRVTFSGSTTPRRLSLHELKSLVMFYRQRLSPEQAEKVGKLMGVRPAIETRTMGDPMPGVGGADSALDKIKAGIKRCNQSDIRDVAARLGLDRERPICPGCGRGGTSSVAYVGNVLNCKYETCNRVGKTNRGPCDLVLQIVFNTPELKGHSRQVMAWFHDNFGVQA